MAVLKLKDDIDTVDFINDTEYAIEDGTLEISMPQRNDIRYASVGSGGANLVSANYENRIIDFSFFVYGNTDQEVNTRISKISKMIVRSVEPVYIGGSGYSAINTPSVGSNTGESGLVFISRLHDEGGPSKKNESNVTQALDLSIVYKIVTANLTVDSRHSANKTMHNRRAEIDNLVTNSTFEADISDWSVLSSSTLDYSADQAHTGSRSLGITPSGTNSGAYITMENLVEGMIYDVNFWFYGNGGSGNTYYSAIRHDGTNIKVHDFTGTGGWQNVRYTFAARSGSHQLRIQKTTATNNVEYYVDDVSVYSTLSIFARCTLSMEAMPFGSGESYVVLEKTGTGFTSGSLAPFTGTTNHAMAVISADDILGDAPALTRIYTQMQTSADTGGRGIIIAREAGVSVLRCPGYPTFSGSVANAKKVSIYGQRPALTTGINYFRLRIKSIGPTVVEYSTDNGSNYTGNITPEIGVPFALGSTGVEVVFHSITGFTALDYWRFAPHQVAATYSGGAVTIGTNNSANQNELYSANGVNIADFNFTIPKGASGKYKLYAIAAIGGSYSGDASLELQAGIKFFANGMSTTDDMTRTYFDWNKFLITNATLDLGTVDIGTRGNSINGHPSSVSHMSVTIRVRSTQTISGATANIDVPLLYLVPHQDENGFLHLAYGMDAFGGHQVFSNFNPSAPYFGAVNNYFVNGVNINGVSIAALDETHAGNAITLIPGVDNTLLFLPLGSAGTPTSVTPYWKRTTMSNDGSNVTNQTTVVIKPRYLYSE